MSKKSGENPSYSGFVPDFLLSFQTEISIMRFRNITHCNFTIFRIDIKNRM